jgi:hypothetical protein
LDRRLTPERCIAGPEGRYHVEVVMYEVRAHMFAQHIRIVEVGSGEVLLDLWGDEVWRWDAHVRFVGPGRVRVELRRFAHSASSGGRLVAGADRELVIAIDLDRRRFWIERGALDDGDLERALAVSLRAGTA